jgi:hypothetical protein
MAMQDQQQRPAAMILEPPSIPFMIDERDVGEAVALDQDSAGGRHIG